MVKKMLRSPENNMLYKNGINIQSNIICFWTTYKNDVYIFQQSDKHEKKQFNVIYYHTM